MTAAAVADVDRAQRDDVVARRARQRLHERANAAQRDLDKRRRDERANDATPFAYERATRQRQLEQRATRRQRVKMRVAQ